MNSNNPIDKELFEVLKNASMDADGIDWNAFEKKRNEKKRRGLLWFLIAGFILISGAIFIFQCSYTPVSQELVHITAKTSNEKLAKNHISAPNKTKVETPVNSSPQPEIKVFTGKYLNQKKRELHASGLQSHVSVPRNNYCNNRAVDFTSKNPNGDFTKFDSDIPAYLLLSPLKIKRHIFVFDTYKKIDKHFKAMNRTKVTHGTFFLQFQAGPAVNFPEFNVSESGRAFIHKDYSGVRSASERGLAGFGCQLTGGVSFKKLDLSFGLGLANTKVYGNYDFVYSEKPIINTDGTVAGYNLTNASDVKFISKQNYTFVEFPLFVDYRLYTKNKIITSLHLGMVNQFLKNISGELPNALFMDRKDQLSTENFRTYSANLEIGSRLSYQFNDRIQFAITPVYRKNFGFYQVLSYYKNSFNSVGLQLSIRTYL